MGFCWLVLGVFGESWSEGEGNEGEGEERVAGNRLSHSPAVAPAKKGAGQGITSMRGEKTEGDGVVWVPFSSERRGMARDRR